MTDREAPGACTSPELRQLLARYEFGALTPEERVAFEKHILECDACFAELERGEPTVATMRERASSYVRILREEASRGRARARSPLWLRPWALVPAAVILVALVLSQVPKMIGPQPYGDLASFPREEVASDVVRAPGVRDAVRELMEAGAGYFDRGRYADAQRFFRAALDRDPEQAEAAYLLGLSLALSGRAGEASAYLEAAVRLSSPTLEPKASWALANAYLKAGKIDEATRTLDLLGRGVGGYAEKARALRARIPR
jgi:tetratricopeptide (TPR) repeat protein